MSVHVSKFLPTCSEVDGGIQTLQRSTSHFLVRVPIGSEQDRVFPQEYPEEALQVP